MKPAKVLVIGSGGQLGSELIGALREAHGIDNVIASDIREVKTISQSGRFVILDATQKEQVGKFIVSEGITEVYLLAAILSGVAEKQPMAGWNLNMGCLLNILDIASTTKLNKVFWPSSVAVFGPSAPKTNATQHTFFDPTSVYGISKYAGELWCNYYHSRYGVDIRSLRYPGLVGWKMPPGGGTTDYAVDIYFHAARNEAYTCFLKPDTYLPMMYMDDAVRGTLMLMEAPETSIKTRLGYNIGAMSFCPREIAQAIQHKVAGFEMAYSPDYRQQIADSWPASVNDSEARNDWGWQPAYDLTKMTDDMLLNLSSQPISIENQGL